MAEVSQVMGASQADQTPPVVVDQGASGTGADTGGQGGTAGQEVTTGGQGGSAGQGEEVATGGRHKGRKGGHRGGRHHRRRSRTASSSSATSSTSSANSEREDPTGHVATAGQAAPKVIVAADDRFGHVLDYRTYRLANRKQTYGPKQARKMGRLAKSMAHSFGGYPPFSGKEALKIFSWLRKFKKACDDNGVSEGMALYAVPHFLSGDAEMRYTRALPDAGSVAGGAAITTYPEAINWFLETYAEPHTLALAQDKFSRATKEADESVEAFSLRLRGLSDLCGNIHSEGTLKQQLIQGLPEFLRTDAYVYNQPARTFQQLVTYTAGKYKAAKDVMDWAKVAPRSEEVGRRTVVTPRGPTPRSRFPMMALGDAGATQEDNKEVEDKGDPRAQDPRWAHEPATRRFLAARRPEQRGPLRCYLRWEAGHMAHQCKMLTAGQREAIVKARDAFLNSTRGYRKAPEDAKYKEQRALSRMTRVAVVQALCEGIEISDAEEEAREEALQSAPQPAYPPPASGEA